MAALCDYISDENQGSGAPCSRTPEHFVEIIYTEPQYVENPVSGNLVAVGGQTSYAQLFLCSEHIKSDPGLFHVENNGDGEALSNYTEFINTDYGDEMISVTVRDTTGTSGDDADLFL